MRTGTIEIVPDDRGESDAYEAFSFVCRNANGSIRWAEGVRKDRAAMYPEFEAMVAAYLAKTA